MCRFSSDISLLCILLCGLVDTSRAGAGEVGINVKCENKKMPTKVINKGGGHYKGYCMPKEPTKHVVFVSFSKEPVPG